MNNKTLQYAWLIIFTNLFILPVCSQAQWVPTSGPSGNVVSCFAISGENTFAGTWEGGIFLSTNRGINWTQVNNGISTELFVHALALTGTNLFAGTNQGVYLSTDNGANWKIVNNGLTNVGVQTLIVSSSGLLAGTRGGIFLSTDNGTSWSKVNNDDITIYNVMALAECGVNMFAGTGTAGILMGGLFCSKDKGTTWAKIENGPKNTSVYALAVRNNNIFAGTDSNGVFLSTDYGANWTKVNSGLSDTCVYSLAISGTNIYAGTSSGIFLSNDNGSTWSKSNNGLTSTSVLACLAYGKIVFAGTAGGGIFRSVNSGNNWEEVNKGLTNTHVQDLIFYGTNLFACTKSDGVFRSPDYGTSWIKINNGLSNTYTVALSASGTNLFVGTYDSDIFFSTDQGDSWNKVNTGWWGILQALFSRGDNLFASIYGQGVFHSTDNGTIWEDANNGLTTTNVISFTAKDMNLFAGTDMGVFLSTDNGTSWKEVNNGLTNLVVSALAVCGSSIFAGTSEGVFLSTDNGTSWEEASTGLTNTNINALAARGNNLFASTIIHQGFPIPIFDSRGGGVFLSTNFGNTWIDVSTGLGSRIVETLVVGETDIFAGTKGSGVWRRPLSEMINNYYTISTSSNPQNGGITTGSGIYAPDISVTVIATPNNGYRFIDWTENGNSVSTNSNYEFIISSDRNLTANFSNIPSLSVTPAFIEVNSLSGTGVFQVSNTTGGTMSWKAVSNASWIIIPNDTVGINEGTIHIDYQVNSGEARIGTITVTAPEAIGSPKMVEVRQAIYSDVEKFDFGKPVSFKLSQNYPNPFNPTTTFDFQLPISSFVTIKLFNILGDEVAVLFEKQYSAGRYHVEWNASDFTSGVYYFRINAGKYSETKKLILMR